MPSLDEQFDAAVWIIQALPKKGPIDSPITHQLKMYGLFKQATIGICNTKQPPFYKIEDRLKWNAWNSLGDMEIDVAKAEYIERFLKSIEDAENQHDISELFNDPRVSGMIHQQHDFRERFAILGRTSVKGFEGQTINVRGVELKL